jgi:RNA polymerase sigma-70 factor, ECF subfamily
MNDQEQGWVEAARHGDKQSFSRLVQAYQRPVYNLTYRMLGNAEEAEDAAQETFLRAYARLSQYDPGMKFSTWVFSIANHHCIDRLRKRRTTQISIDDNPVLENMEGETPQPEHLALDKEQSVEMQRLIGMLDPDYRTPLILRYWEDMSYEEIAEAMNMTVAAVKSRLFRARQQLVALYQRREREPAPPNSGGKPPKAARNKSTTSGQALHMRLGLANL